MKKKPILFTSSGDPIYETSTSANDNPADNAQGSKHENSEASQSALTNNAYAEVPEEESTSDKNYPAPNPKPTFPIFLWRYAATWWTDPYRRKANAPEIITGILTFFIAVTGFLTWQVYRQQKKIMESSGQQTDKIIQAADTQAGAAKRIAKASDRNAAAADRFASAADGINRQSQAAAGAMADQVEKMQTGVVETHALAGAAQDAANIARDALIGVQRPWLGLDGLPIIDFNQGFYSASVRNFGIAPALNFGVMIRRAKTENLKEEMDDTCVEARHRSEAGLYIFPGQPYPYRSSRFFERGGNTNINFSLVGCIVNFGKFSGPHRTPFCFTSGLPTSKTTAESLLVPCPLKYGAD